MSNPQEITSVVNYCGYIQNIRPIKDGVNDSYIVTGEDSTYFLKIETDPTARLQTEIWVNQQLQDHIPLPTLHLTGKTPDGNNYFLAQHFSSKQGPYPRDLTQTNKRLIYQLGKLLGKIHTQSLETYGKLPPSKDTVYSSWKSFYRDWLTYTLEDAKKNYPETASQIMSLIHWAEIPEPEDYTFSSLDFHTRNIFHTNGNIDGVIDLERCFSGHPLWSFEITKELLSHSPLSDATERFETGYQYQRSLPLSSPCYKLGGLARSMRAARIIWDDPKEKKSYFRDQVDRIETTLENQ
jgi:aminoglycoside phosphotransferase (APT) family kinase protein